MASSLTQSYLINILQYDFENIKEIFNLEIEENDENDENEENEEKKYYTNQLKIISKYEINYYKNNTDNFNHRISVFTRT